MQKNNENKQISGLSKVIDRKSRVQRVREREILAAQNENITRGNKKSLINKKKQNDKRFLFL